MWTLEEEEEEVENRGLIWGCGGIELEGNIECRLFWLSDMTDDLMTLFIIKIFRSNKITL